MTMVSEVIMMSFIGLGLEASFMSEAMGVRIENTHQPTNPCIYLFRVSPHQVSNLGTPVHLDG